MTVKHNIAGANQNNNAFALVCLTSLFFMWGFITCLNDILIPYLKDAFELNYTQAMLIQFCFFGAYFLTSLPAGKLVSKIGYQKGIVVGLLIACLGCLLFYPAASMKLYALFLLALFVLATGITLLQVSANPYVAALGDPSTASSRLTMTQAFNSLGTTVAPFFGAWLLFSNLEHGSSDASEAKVPYLILAFMLLILAVIFAKLVLPKLHKATLGKDSDDVVDSDALFAPLQHKHLRLGMLGIFVYVGAEVAIGSFLVNYLQANGAQQLTEAAASSYLAYYWGGAMVGRFIGAWVMQKLSASVVLGFNAAMAIVLIALSITFSGPIAMWLMLAVGLCNSIMFPTIFSLAIHGLGKQASQASGLLCLAIVGGAIVPLMQGVLADTIGLQASFVLPIFCYAYIVFYGFKGSNPHHSTY
ncbi:MAG: sugar MFS transporter [Glaciecola sp.]